MRILLVDDEESVRESMAEALTELGHQPETCPSGEAALELCGRSYYPLIITDLRMRGMSGIDLLKVIKSNSRTDRCDIVILTGHGDMDTAIEALRAGAYDYLKKPINARELAALVERAAEHQMLLNENQELTERFNNKLEEATREVREDFSRIKEAFLSSAGLDGIVCESESMRKITENALIYHNDPTIPVMIEGETGTGKEIIARLIHYGDKGSDGEFVDINCSAISSELFESELFGYSPGAFTGGQKEGKKGKLELADNGTLFLDEIGEMPLELQPKLLRVLQDRSFFRVGGLKKQKFTARVICATNRNLDVMVEAGSFRRDLYHRLDLGHIRIPPLRERPDDIEALAKHFLQAASGRRKKNIAFISPEVMDALLKYEWPGNVRELENAIERAVLIAEGERLELKDLDFIYKTKSTPAKSDSQIIALEDFELPENNFDLENMTNSIILKALEKFDGNKSEAAKYLGISRHALRRKLEKLD
ncbi:MAG: sigma-54-dependent Fis family transcriptional regulator [Planctomycetes bacterium]|nr:sigma-54-dependent Fis family transcriptional regulator [Planctomycetota bacterium]